MSTNSTTASAAAILADKPQWLGRPTHAIPVLFVAVILVSGLLGSAVAEFYSEPMNRFLRRRFARRTVQLQPVGAVVGRD